MKTGKWVRRAALGKGVVITERGRPVASLLPVRPGDLSTPFRERRTSPESIPCRRCPARLANMSPRTATAGDRRLREVAAVGMAGEA